MEHPQHRKKSDGGGKCCVETCDNKKCKNLELSFHKVPKAGSAKIARKNLFGKIEIVDKRSEWLRLLKVNDCNKDLLVCSLHFAAKNYFFPDVHTKRKKLKPDALPESVSVSEKRKILEKEREERAERRSLKPVSKVDDTTQKDFCQQNVICEASISTNDTHKLSLLNVNIYTQEKSEKKDYVESASNSDGMEPINHDFDCEAQVYCDAESVECNIQVPSVDNLDNDEKVENNIQNKIAETKTYCEKGVQVTSDDIIISFASFIKTKKDLITMCNIKSFSILNKLTTLMDEIYPRKKKWLLNTRESIMLVTVKLKLDISFNALRVLFNQVTEVTIRNTFYDTVPKLASILKSVVLRVPKEEIMRNMPKCFDKFRSTTSVLDCTEIKIQQPKCLKCRVKFYSHYKGSMTVKFMTEVTPAGFIVCISESFGGRASDKTIFNHTGILKDLESTRDAVIVDKGFLIDDKCAQKRIKLIRPPFLKNQKQLSESEAIRNREIASARVHVERMNQRIKQFQILNNVLPWHLVNYIDDIFLICCGLANLDTPILADDKF